MLLHTHYSPLQKLISSSIYYRVEGILLLSRVIILQIVVSHRLVGLVCGIVILQSILTAVLGRLVCCIDIDRCHTQDKEGVGFGVAGGEEVTEGAVVVVEMIPLLGFRVAVDEGVTEGTVVVEETSTNDGCGGGILQA